MTNDYRLDRFLRALLVLGVFGTLMSGPQPAYASLSPQDQDDLTESLVILSTGWVQEHVDRANSILSKDEYTSADWHEFFSEFFSAYPFTDHLRDYLGYPVFWWFDDNVHLKLQTGLVRPLQTMIQDIVATHDADLGHALETDTNLRQTLFNSHRFFNHMFNMGVIPEETQAELYNFYTGHVSTYPLLWKSTVTIDTSSQRYVAAVRAQIYMNLGDALPLTPARIAEISQTIDLSGTYAELWTDYTVLLIDNNGLNPTQLDVARAYLGVLPAGIHDLRYITVNSLLGNEGTHYEWLACSAGVNIFDIEVGARHANAFPDDVSPVYTDLFALVLSHEVNHRVDATFTRTDTYLAQRRDDLIEAAGPNRMNYLRSMFEDGFFVNAPQEFFASISNQWFADTAHTLELGLVRWNSDYEHPINQFLFFAEVYSQGGNTVPFYSMDEGAHLSRIDIPVLRDIYGHICTLTVDGNAYRFLLNSEGDVLDVLPVLLATLIDIKPGSDPNSINCNNEKGVITVAILTSEDFDATTVDHTTVTFEGASETHMDKKSGEPRRHEEDVDDDGDADLVLHFRMGDTDLACDSEEGTLTGETFDGLAIEGTDAIRMVDRGGGGR